MNGPKIQKFVTIGNPTLTQVPCIGPKAHENLEANGIDLAQLIEAGLHPGRIHLPIDRMGDIAEMGWSGARCSNIM